MFSHPAAVIDKAPLHPLFRAGAWHSAVELASQLG
jgi:hypothetical protein